jgi:hypothetical protein
VSVGAVDLPPFEVRDPVVATAREESAERYVSEKTASGCFFLSRSRIVRRRSVAVTLPVRRAQ